jgi:hypothetical protein
MVKIDRFTDFDIEKKTLYVFDFDDTLVVTPRYEDIAINYLKENLTVKDLVDKSINSIGISKSQLKVQDGRIYVDDPKMELKENPKYWVRKGQRLYLIQPDEFSFLDESLPKSIKSEIVELYKSVENKCIVTARPKEMRNKIEAVLEEFGLNNPKWGLHMCPDVRMNAGKWKGEKIMELATSGNFSKVIFYDDNSKYIRNAKKVIYEKMPNLNFIAIKV